MRFFIFVAVSVIAISLAGNLDPKEEAKKFVNALYEHLLAKNYSIIDQEFVFISPVLNLTRQQFIDIFSLKGNLTKPVDLYNYDTSFTPEGLLKFVKLNDTTRYGFAKPNSNIKGGYSLVKIVYEK